MDTDVVRIPAIVGVVSASSISGFRFESTGQAKLAAGRRTINKPRSAKGHC